MHMKPKHIVWATVVVILVPLGLYLLNSDLPGKRTQSGNVVTKTLGSVKGDTSSSFDITLREGGDPAHESDHVFESIKNPAVESASFNVDTSQLEVRYDGASISESDIRQLLVKSGYVAATSADAVPAELSADSKSQSISLSQADQALEPRLIRARAGVPLKLVFGQGTAHLASITIAEFGITQDLSQGGATVEVSDPKPGTYDVVCAEGYPDATLIVE